ncbi:unnamed protein product [Penicillium glandicola]
MDRHLSHQICGLPGDIRRQVDNSSRVVPRRKVEISFSYTANASSVNGSLPLPRIERLLPSPIPSSTTSIPLLLGSNEKIRTAFSPAPSLVALTDPSSVATLTTMNNRDAISETCAMATANAAPADTTIIDLMVILES